MNLKLKTFCFILISFLFLHQVNARIIKVPSEVETIQQAILDANNWDTILVARGVYHENIVISDKDIVLASNFIFSRDTVDIDSTILNGDDGDYVLRLRKTSVDTKIVGFTIENADDGVTANSLFTFEHNLVRNTSDGMDYEEGSGGICKYNIFELNSDDGIDLDGDVDILIEENIIRNNEDDGIEIRLHSYSGEVLYYNIRNNKIENHGEDGIQIIDYADISDRVISISDNQIINSKMAGIGFMSDGNTKENYEAAEIPENIIILNNVIDTAEYGISGGGNCAVLNNTISNIEYNAFKGIKGETLIMYHNSILSENMSALRSSLLGGQITQLSFFNMFNAKNDIGSIIQ